MRTRNKRNNFKTLEIMAGKPTTPSPESIYRMRKAQLANAKGTTYRKKSKQLVAWLISHPEIAEKYAQAHKEAKSSEDYHFAAAIAWQTIRADKELLSIPRVELKVRQAGSKKKYWVEINGEIVATRTSAREYYATLITREPGGKWRESTNYFGRPDLLLSSSEVKNHFRYGTEVVLACIDLTLLPGSQGFDPEL